jgi:hypothetical protein
MRKRIFILVVCALTGFSGVKHGLNKPETDWTMLAGTTFRF